MSNNTLKVGENYLLFVRMSENLDECEFREFATHEEAVAAMNSVPMEIDAQVVPPTWWAVNSLGRYVWNDKTGGE